MSTLSVIALSAALATIPCACAAFAMSLATSKAADSMARQPEAAGRISSSLMFGLIMMETTAVYALLSVILIIVFLGGAA